MHKILCLLIVLVLGVNEIDAQDYYVNRPELTLDSNRLILYKDSTSGNFSSKLEKIEEFGYWYMKHFPVPYFSYSTETSWLFGISKYNAFTLRKGDTTDQTTMCSSLNLFTYFTFEHQFKIAFESNLMLNKNKAIWKTNVFYTDYPIEYFGTGNNTKLEDQRTLVTSDWQFHTYYLFRVMDKWYVGPTINYLNYYKVELEEGSEHLPADSLNLYHNIGLQSGGGIRIQHEGRDNRFNATKGWYFDLSYEIFNQGLGGDFNYHFFHADIRNYFAVRPKLIFAWQARTESKIGEVPVQSLALLGGDYIMRGTYRGRYRDKVLVDAQAELRFPIFWILGGVVYNSIGQVAPTYEKLALNEFHYNYGVGLRVKVDKDNNINLRLDYAFSQDQRYFLINFAEAF